LWNWLNSKFDCDFCRNRVQHEFPEYAPECQGIDTVPECLKIKLMGAKPDDYSQCVPKLAAQNRRAWPLITRAIRGSGGGMAGWNYGGFESVLRIFKVSESHAPFLFDLYITALDALDQAREINSKK